MEKRRKVIKLLDLPDELILSVLRHVNFRHIVHGVYRIRNRRLRRICDDDSLWADVILDGKDITLDQSPVGERYGRLRKYFDYPDLWDRSVVCDDEAWTERVSHAATKIIVRSGVRMRRLTMQWWYEWNPGALAAFALDRCPNLVRLTYGQWGEELLAAVDRSASLRELTGFSLEVLNYVHCFSKLTLLHTYFSGHHNYPDRCLVAIADKCRSLESFRMAGISCDFSDGALGYFLRRIGDTLKHLYLDLSSISGLTGASLADLSHCPVLQILHISHGVRLLAGDGLNAVVGVMTLRELSLSSASLGEEKSSEEIVNVFAGRKLETMTCLKFDNEPCVDGAVLAAIAGSCPNLVRLELNECRGVTMGGLKSVVLACLKLRCLKMPRLFPTVRKLIMEDAHPALYIDTAIH